jgi:CheY-like chemotaxis protein
MKVLVYVSLGGAMAFATPAASTAVKQLIIPVEKFINILFVDDDPAQFTLLRSLLESSYVNIVHAASIDAARLRIRQQSLTWHCWILDINLGLNSNGLTLLDEFSHFPYIIVLSGLGNMRLSFEATRKGALEVFDKTPEILRGSFLEKVYRTAVLGYLLQGKNTDYLNTFLCLKELYITSAPNWAETACIGIRYLERLCNLHVGLAPRYVIPLYYTVYYHLICKNEVNNSQADCSNRFGWQQRAFFQLDIDFVKEHFDATYRQYFEKRRTANASTGC